MHRFLPYSRQCIDESDIAAVARALRSEFLTTGPMVEKFEEALARETGAREAVVCNSGTAALHLAVLALDVGPGDAVIVPAVTFLATANVNRMAGADVFFADVDPDTGLLTDETLEDAIVVARSRGLRPVLAMPVHLNGAVCNMEQIASVARRYDIQLVEDACHALGEEQVGATRHSRAACFSMHAVKNLTTGEGGAVTTTDDELADRMRRLRNHGMVREFNKFEDRQLSFSDNEPNPWSYEMPEIGWNYRLPDILCALGLSQLSKLKASMARRQEIANLYNRLLAPLAPTIRPVPDNGQPHGRHLYPLLIDFRAVGMTRSKMMKKLHEQGIGSQVHYIPVHRQPYYRKRYGDLMLPGAHSYYERCLSIPFFPSMSNDDVAYVVANLTALMKK